MATTDDMVVVVNAAQANQPPSVNAGLDQTITFPSAAGLSGTATDDGLPSGSTLTRTWSKVSGPGTVTFGNASSLNTTATFSVAGSYTLRLTASDGAMTTTDDVVIVANTCGPVVSGTVTLVATATDNVGVAGTQFKLDGVNLGPNITTSPYSQSWNTLTAANGCHMISATAQDGAGNQGTASLSATVNNP
jgi:hypothetical protein